MQKLSFWFQKTARARDLEVLHPHQIEAPTMTVSSIYLRILGFITIGNLNLNNQMSSFDDYNIYDDIYFTFPSFDKGVKRVFIAGDRLGLSENKFGRLPGTRLPEQKPFRGFDITSLIRKDGAEEAGGQRASSVNRAESKSTNLGQRSRRLHQSSNVNIASLVKN